jgi:hypothetical protein
MTSIFGKLNPNQRIWGVLGGVVVAGTVFKVKYDTVYEMFLLVLVAVVRSGIAYVIDLIFELLHSPNDFLFSLCIDDDINLQLGRILPFLS